MISVLQVASIDSGASQPTTVLAFGSNVTAGSTLVAIGLLNFATLTGFTDTLGNTFTSRQTAQSAAGPGNQKLYCYTAPSPSGGADSVTMTIGSAQTFRPVYLLEIGGAKAAAYDVGNHNDQTAPGLGAGAVLSGSASNLNQPALIVAATLTISNTANAAPVTGTGQAGHWGGNSGCGLSVQTQRITATGAQQATWTAAVNNEHLSLEIILDELLGVNFRKTLSRIGGKIGQRQLQV